MKSRSLVSMLALLACVAAITATTPAAIADARLKYSEECSDDLRSVMMQKICYDLSAEKLVVTVAGRDNEFCNVPAAMYQDLISVSFADNYYVELIALSPTYKCGAGG